MKDYTIPCIYMKEGKAVAGLPADGRRNCRCAVYSEPYAHAYSALNAGDPAVMLFDLSETDEEHERAIAQIRFICEKTGLPHDFRQ